MHRMNPEIEFAPGELATPPRRIIIRWSSVAMSVLAWCDRERAYLTPDLEPPASLGRLAPCKALEALGASADVLDGQTSPRGLIWASWGPILAILMDLPKAKRWRGKARVITVERLTRPDERPKTPCRYPWVLESAPIAFQIVQELEEEQSPFGHRSPSAAMKVLRSTLYWTQEQAAAEAGCSKSIWAQVEAQPTGGRTYRLPRAALGNCRKLAEELGLGSLAEAFGYWERYRPPETRGGHHLTKDEDWR